MTGPGKGKRLVGVVIPLGEKQPSGEKPADRLIEPLSMLVSDDMTRVNQTIVARTGSDVAMIPEVANHLISSGGKRLRPILTLATAGMCDYAGTGHVKLAAAVEFMHTATLLHDDVVDESDMRRGKAAARMLWGNEASVLVGDFLLGQAFKMMVEVGSLPCLEVLSNAATVIAEGEVMQLSAAKDTETTEDAYLAVIRAKTAALFAAACEVGPILANRPKSEVAACRGYGANLGIAFQLIDDALDYGGSSARLGKNVGDDFREGKITLPVVLSFRRGTPTEREFWRRTLERGEVVDGDLETAARDDEEAPRPRGYDRARPPLRRDGARCARALPRFALEARAARCGRVRGEPRPLRELGPGPPGASGGRIPWCREKCREFPAFRPIWGQTVPKISCDFGRFHENSLRGRAGNFFGRAGNSNSLLQRKAGISRASCAADPAPPALERDRLKSPEESKEQNKSTPSC